MSRLKPVCWCLWAGIDRDTEWCDSYRLGPTPLKVDTSPLCDSCSPAFQRKPAAKDHIDLNQPGPPVESLPRSPSHCLLLWSILGFGWNRFLASAHSSLIHMSQGNNLHSKTPQIICFSFLMVFMTIATAASLQMKGA